jgi:hypothetical protein
VEGKQLAFILLGGALCQLLLPVLIRPARAKSGGKRNALQA